METLVMSDGGKGSGRRPSQVSTDEWNSRWDAIFSRDLKETSDEHNIQQTQEPTPGPAGQDNSR